MVVVVDSEVVMNVGEVWEDGVMIVLAGIEYEDVLEEVEMEEEEVVPAASEDVGVIIVASGSV